MSFKSALRTVALGTAAVVGVFGVATLAVQFNETAHPVSQGQEYLTDQGYKNISGGEADYFNGCGKNVFARSYDVTNPRTGERETRTVCFNPLFGPSGPLLGK
jgi:hypothetical protein